LPLDGCKWKADTQRFINRGNARTMISGGSVSGLPPG
jgi:hypothetical protein